MVQDAETRFEEQISKLVLEKQELEWEKVRLGLAGFASASLVATFWHFTKGYECLYSYSIISTF